MAKREYNAERGKNATGHRPVNSGRVSGPERINCRRNSITNEACRVSKQSNDQPRDCSLFQSTDRSKLTYDGTLCGAIDHAVGQGQRARGREVGRHLRVPQDHAVQEAEKATRKTGEVCYSALRM